MLQMIAFMLVLSAMGLHENLWQYHGVLMFSEIHWYPGTHVHIHVFWCEPRYSIKGKSRLQSALVLEIYN